MTQIHEYRFLFVTQVTIRLRDGGTPARYSQREATLTVNVLRNDHIPQFANSSYETTIRSDKRSGSSVFRVTATDLDEVNIN